MNSPDLTGRLFATGQLLVRSGIEIARLFDAICEDGDSVTANLQDKGLFLSRLLHVDSEAQSMLLAYCDHKPANAAVLSARSVNFSCFHRGGQYGWTGTQPRSVMHDGAPAIRFAFPTTLLASQQRRAHARVQVPPEAPLVCHFRIGGTPLQARVADVSLDGMGTLLFAGNLRAAPGTRLDNVIVRHPDHAPILVDLEIRHATRVPAGDGKLATRIGCRILSQPGDLEKLIRLFIVDL